MAKAKKRKRKAVKRKVIRAKRKPVKRKRRTPAKKRHKRRVTGVKKKVTRAKSVKRRRKRSTGRKLVKQVEKRSVERVMSGHRRKRRTTKRRVVMAGRPRRRSVSGAGGSSKLLIGLAIGAAAIYFLTRKSSTTAIPSTYNLPPLSQTSNYNRNTKSQDLVNYALAAGLAFDAISKLIDKLNTSSDQQVDNIYDVYHSTGELNYIA